MTTQPIPSATDDLIAEIDAAMASATPGYWYQSKGIGVVVDHNDCGVVCETHEDNPVDAIYIAACNPSNVRQLIARIRDLEAERATYRQGIGAVAELIDNSTGVAGLHLNGDIASWCDLRTGGRFEEWLRAFDEVPEISL
jgi:hypothetical protein|tara:strand:- start:4257 stop:4676 length:420 start_codon:yes stop_codon:yes gene_type:complete